MCDETIRVAVRLRLGLNLYEAYACPCGALVSAWGTHGLSCKSSGGRSTRHDQVDLIWRALKRGDVPVTIEPSGLLRGDGKRPDGLILVPWQNVWYLTWDATVVISLAPSFSNIFASSFGSRSSCYTLKFEIRRHHADAYFRAGSGRNIRSY